MTKSPIYLLKKSVGYGAIFLLSGLFIVHAEDLPDLSGVVDETNTTIDLSSSELPLVDVSELFTGTSSEVLRLALERPLLELTLDSNTDGTIDAAEVANSKRSILKLDLDSDGVISSVELGAKENFPVLLRIHPVQQALDLDGDNQLSSLEVLEAESQLKLLDTNANWKIERTELLSPLTQENISSWEWQVARVDQGMVDVSSSTLANSEFYLVHEADTELGLKLGLRTALLNNRGELQHQWKHATPAVEGSRSELLPNGLLLRSSSISTRKPFSTLDNQHGLIELVDWNGNVVWKYQRCQEKIFCLYGPIKSLPNGNILVVSYETEALLDGLSEGNERSKTATIFELQPSYDDASTNIVWQWSTQSGNEEIPDTLAGLSYDAELNQIVYTSSDHKRIIMIERGMQVTNAALHSITVEDLLAEGESGSDLEIVDAQWLQDISSQADIALLVKKSDQYSIMQMSLPINKNGTYRESLKPLVVMELPLSELVDSSSELHGLTPLENGGFLLLDKTSNRIVSIDQLGKQKVQPSTLQARVTNVEIYQQNYAAFNDKELMPTAVAITNDLPVTVSQQPDVSTETTLELNAQSELTGIWSMLLDTPMGEEAFELTLVQQGDLIAGDLDGDPLTVKVVENTIEMTLVRASPAGQVSIIYSGIIDAAGIRGEYLLNSGPTTGTSRGWSATR